MCILPSMTAAIIIVICVLLLLAYLFDITAPTTRIRAVVVLLLLGYLVKQAPPVTDLKIPRRTPLLPILRTIGLILIVLEGALELELNRSKRGVVIRSFSAALMPILMLSFGMAWLFSHYLSYSFRAGLINVMPLCVISSSIAISAARKDRKSVV